MATKSIKASTEYGVDWGLHHDPSSNVWDRDQIQIILLQQIRDELATLNQLLACPNFTGIPGTLRRIAQNTTKRPRVRKGKP
jgi:hypothetical protein